MRHRTSEYYRRIVRPVSYVVVGMGIFMLVCAIVGFLVGTTNSMHPELDKGAALPVAIAGAVTMATGGGLWAWSRSVPEGHFGRRQATLAVAMIWFFTGILGGLPFVFTSGMPPVDAFFEAVSGFTTTGATIVGDIEGTLSRTELLWRSVIQWLGGMGIVVLFVAVFPNVGVGGKHMFRSEVPGPTADGLQPRIAETSILLWRLYFAFTALQAVILWMLGMSIFESVCHSMTTLSTGGFSTRNASMAAFDSASIEMVTATFMLLAGVNFGLYYGALRGRSARVFLRSTEFRVYGTVVVLATALLTIGIRGNHDGSWTESFRYAYFMVATTITSTGFGTDAYMEYPPASLTIVLLMMFAGGMSGSTAGGIKMARIALLSKMAQAQIRRSFRPSMIQVVRMGRKAVPAAVQSEVGAFLVIFMACLGAGTLLVSWSDGVPPETAFGAMLSCLSNMGPGPFFLETDNFAAYSDFAKLVFSFAMILGRLEFFTILALFLPDFWRS